MAIDQTLESTEPSIRPTRANERIAAIDVLRGCALLGILVVNIGGFALPEIMGYDPRVGDGFTGANYAVWLVSHVVFEQKMMSIFSMLFGAGLVLMTDRADSRGASLLGIYYRRTAWLLVFGLIHSYFLWEGDILVPYGLCALLLYPCRRFSPWALIVLGMFVFLLAVPISSGVGMLTDWLRNNPEALGTSPEKSAAREQLLELLEEFYPPMDRAPEAIAKEIALYQDGYWKLFRHRAELNIWEQTVGFFLWAGPRAGGLMLLGMALMKLGWFSGARSARFYASLAVIGYGLGLPVVIYGVNQLIAHEFDIVYEYTLGSQFNYVGSLFVALGHVGLILLVCKMGWMPWLRARLANVGRMALSNYFLQTLICTTLFFGWGFGLFGLLDRLALAGVVVLVWSFQLAVSSVWLRYFRFGPMEWLWRSLTYAQLQPLSKHYEPQRQTDTEKVNPEEMDRGAEIGGP